MGQIKMGTFTGEPLALHKNNLIVWDSSYIDFSDLPNGSDIEQFTLQLDQDITENQTKNYAEINGYYYFVEPVKIGSNSINNFEFTMDYLMSFQEDIENMECIIERSAKFSNAYLNDSNYVTSTKTETITKEFPNGMTDDTIILMTVG